VKITTRYPILLIEDSPEDFQATVRSFRKANVGNPIFRCADGEEALDFLHQRGPFADAVTAPRPAIILLDLNLPGTDGREVLAEIKASPKLRIIPVVILTTSAHELDIEQCYRCGANSYIQKPVEMAAFFAAIVRIKDYWFDTVEVAELG
jgi:two-component system, response regulator